MRIKIHSSELNRMMKTIMKCIDSRHKAFSNIEIIYDNNLLTIRGTNGNFAAVMSAPVLGGDGESFCVDGDTFGKVCALCKGEMEIITDGKICTVKGAGRTRIPIVNAEIPAFARVKKGTTAKLAAQDFQKAYNGISHAISNEENQSRVVLTGVNVEIDSTTMRMVALDGFIMAVEEIGCDGEETKMVIPGAFMRLIKDSTVSGEQITLKSDGNKVQASTDGMMISSPLLVGDFPDYRRILPTEFKTESLVNAEKVCAALKSSAVVCNNSKLVKFEVSADMMTVSGNSEQADYEAEIGCSTQGDGLKIAFNQKYIADTIGSIDADEVVMKFNSSVSPCVVCGKGKDGVRLVLPVRVMG